MKLGQEILYLSNADVEASGLGLADVELAVEAMFAAKAEGRTLSPEAAIESIVKGEAA